MANKNGKHTHKDEDITTREFRIMRKDGRLDVVSARRPAHHGWALFARAVITIALLVVGYLIRDANPSALLMIIGAVIGYWVGTGETEVQMLVENAKNGRDNG